MSAQVNHLTNEDGKLKKVPFVDTPRDPSEPIKISVRSKYSELLVLMNNQMKENARMHSSIVWFKAMSVWSFVLSFALVLGLTILK